MDLFVKCHLKLHIDTDIDIDARVGGTNVLPRTDVVWHYAALPFLPRSLSLSLSLCLSLCVSLSVRRRRLAGQKAVEL